MLTITVINTNMNILPKITIFTSKLKFKLLTLLSTTAKFVIKSTTTTKVNLSVLSITIIPDDLIGFLNIILLHSFSLHMLYY